jgi:RHS repeat-associated protein
VTVLDYGSERYEYSYDGSNMMKYLASDTGLARTFLYSAADERVVQMDCETAGCGVDDAKHTWTLRDASMQVLRTYTRVPGRAWTWEKDYIHRGGKLLASVDPGGVMQLHPDHLGSPRQITKSSGAQESMHSYYPFGQEATGAAQDDVALKFTGHERDVNDNRPKGILDYMLLRFCNPFAGRFFSVDPQNRRKSTGGPQVWNRYAYAANSPINYVDPNGRDPIRFQEGGRDKALWRMLVRFAQRKSGRDALARIAQRPGFKASLADARLVDISQVMANRRSRAESAIAAGDTSAREIQGPGGSRTVTGADIRIDTSAIQRLHADSSGVTTLGHEVAGHTGDLLNGLLPEETGSRESEAEATGASILMEESDLTAEEAAAFLESEILENMPPE